MSALRILLVEDEAMLLRLLQRHLERSGHFVIAAASAKAALEAIQGDWIPDVLITDESLPGEASGTELAVGLLECMPRLVCILCSGYVLSLQNLPEAVRGRAAILAKPYQPSALDHAIALVLASRSAAGPSAIE